MHSLLAPSVLYSRSFLHCVLLTCSGVGNKSIFWPLILRMCVCHALYWVFYIFNANHFHFPQIVFFIVSFSCIEEQTQVSAHGRQTLSLWATSLSLAKYRLVMHEHYIKHEKLLFIPASWGWKPLHDRLHSYASVRAQNTKQLKFKHYPNNRFRSINAWRAKLFIYSESHISWLT